MSCFHVALLDTGFGGCWQERCSFLAFNLSCYCCVFSESVFTLSCLSQCSVTSREWPCPGLDVLSAFFPTASHFPFWALNHSQFPPCPLLSLPRLTTARAFGTLRHCSQQCFPHHTANCEQGLTVPGLCSCFVLGSGASHLHGAVPSNPHEVKRSEDLLGRGLSTMCLAAGMMCNLLCWWLSITHPALYILTFKKNNAFHTVFYSVVLCPPHVVLVGPFNSKNLSSFLRFDLWGVLFCVFKTWCFDLSEISCKCWWLYKDNRFLWPRTKQHLLLCCCCVVEEHKPK